MYWKQKVLSNLSKYVNSLFNVATVAEFIQISESHIQSGPLWTIE